MGFLAQKWVSHFHYSFVFVPKLEPRLTKRFFTFYNEAIWSILQNKRGTMRILTSSRVFCQSSMLLWPNRQCCFLSFSHVCYSLLFNRSSSVVGIRKQLKIWISAKNNQPSCSDKSRYTHTNVVYLDLGALSSFLFFFGNEKGRRRRAELQIESLLRKL